MIESDSMRRFASSAPLATVVRVVLIVAIIFVGWSVARTFARVIADWRGPARPDSARDAAAANLDSMPALLPLAGQWAFADLDFSIRSRRIAADEVAAYFESATPPIALADNELPDADKELLKLLEKLPVKSIRIAGNEVYRLDRPELKIQLVLRMVAGRPKAAGFAAALAHGDGSWQLLELTPQESSKASSPNHSHLMPLPAGARRSGGRYADDGRLLLELITLETNGEKLLDSWRAAVWEVRPAGVGEAAAFSYLCARGEASVYAWSANPGHALRHLMLVHAPAPADTGDDQVKTNY